MAAHHSITWVMIFSRPY